MNSVHLQTISSLYLLACCDKRLDSFFHLCSPNENKVVSLNMFLCPKQVTLCVKNIKLFSGMPVQMFQNMAEMETTVPLGHKGSSSWPLNFG